MTTNRSLVQAAAAASAAAGLVHAAAAGSHASDQALALVFAATAAVQVGWAAAVLLGDRAAWVRAGAALNGVFVAAWALSRTVGLTVGPFEGVEEVGTQDGLAAALGALAAVAALVACAPPVRERTAMPRLAGAGVAFSLLLAVPAMAAEHAHDHGGGAGHDDGHGHAEGEVAAGHDHGVDEHTDDHGDEHGDEVATTSGGHHHGEMPAHLDHEPTEAQLEDAKALVDDTKAATARFVDVAVAEAEGYRSIGDGMTGTEHWVHPDHNADDVVLDPEAPESLVYRVHPDGSKELITVMYILPRGSTMDDAPDIAGNLTQWHDHQNLCWNEETGRLAGILRDGQCIPGGVFRPTAPMLHVWVTPNPCGPFAGTDSGQMSGSCVDIEL